MYGKGGMEVWGTLRKHMLKNDPGLAGVGIAKALNKQTNKQGQNPKFKKSRFVYEIVPGLYTMFHAKDKENIIHSIA